MSNSSPVSVALSPRRRSALLQIKTSGNDVTKCGAQGRRRRDGTVVSASTVAVPYQVMFHLSTGERSAGKRYRFSAAIKSLEQIRFCVTIESAL